MITRLLVLLLALSGAANAAAEDDLLPADKAFQLSTRAEGNVVQLTWKIAPGYYLYRNKFRFEALDASRLKDAQFPAGKTKTDPFFGPTEIYTDAVTVRLPVESAGSTARLRVTAQGCNEPVGVCYPPITKDVNVVLAAAPATSSVLPAVQGSFSQALGLGRQEVGPVDPEKAFLVEASTTDGASVAIRFTIDDCCYLYRNKTSFAVLSPAGARLASYELPPGEVMTDQFVGRTEIYRRRMDVRVPVTGAGAAKPSEMVLRVAYQGCSEKGVTICYPPTTRDVPVRLVATDAINTAASTSAGDSFLWALIGAFAGGLLLTFTPCVLPMIPILSGVIVGAEGTRLTKTRGGLLSYTYVFGTAVTYAVAGAIAGATGAQLQAYFQNVWAIGLFSGVLVLLALSMFGLYELHMPAAIQTLLHRHSAKLHEKSKGRRTGEFVGVFFLGAISALIIGACVAPVLAATLGSAIATGDPWLGAGVMFALAHGQGAILVAIGLSEGFLLPRAGPWMQTVKHIFGVLLLGVAIYLLGTLPEVPVLFLWAALFIVCAVYLGATQALPGAASGWRYLQKGLGTLLLIWGTVALLGGFFGGRDIFHPLPLEQLARFGGSPAKESVFKPIRSATEFDAALAAARHANKPVLLDYYATWCTDCVRMERSTFLDPQVREAIATRFVALQVDVTSPDDPATNALKTRFDVYGPPALLFFDASGQEQRSLRTYGYLSATDLLKVLAQL